MVLVHIGLDLKHKAAKVVAAGINRLAGERIGIGARRRGQTQELLEEGLHAKVGERRAKERRAQLAAGHGIQVELVAGTIEQRLREHFTVAGYIFFLNCEQAQRYNILLYSSIAPEDVAPMGIKAFSDVNALLDAAQLEGKSIYVIPNGSTVIPHVKEASKHEA